MTEEELFEIRQKFLREIPHPRLIMKQIERLADVQSDAAEPVTPNSQLDLKIYLEKYLELLLRLKLQIANTSSAKILKSELLNLYQLQLELIHKIYLYYPQNVRVNDDHIKQSDAFDAYELIKVLDNEKIGENQIKNYLYQQFSEASEAHSELTKAVLRAAKIENNGR